jgi:hypothetical protein
MSALGENGAGSGADGSKQPVLDQKADGNGQPTVRWDDANMRSTFANVVNATSTREEISLFFGTNQTWKMDELRELSVLLSNRIVLSPLAARRLWRILGAMLEQHEARFGTLRPAAGEGAPRRS